MVGAVSEVASPDDAAGEMREAIAYLAGIPANHVLLLWNPSDRA